MVNTKNLSLKVLNRLKSVEVDLVRQVMPKKTFAQIEEGCRQRFEIAGNFSMDSARMAVQQLNGELGRKAYVLVTEDNQTACTVYHISPTVFEEAIRDKEREKSEMRRAKAEAKKIEKAFLEKRRKEREAEKKRVEAKRERKEAKEREREARRAEREAKRQERLAKMRKTEDINKLLSKMRRVENINKQ